jgi:hypothetical protein
VQQTPRHRRLSPGSGPPRFARRLPGGNITRPWTRIGLPHAVFRIL